MDERSMALMDHKPIQARSVHHVGDMYIHNKHKFIIRIVGRGTWSSKRACEVVKGEVPEIVLQRVIRIHDAAPYERLQQLLDGGIVPLVLDYSTCALTTCFTRLKAGQVLFG